jgi:choice-of-anchor A domain-containing protein
VNAADADGDPLTVVWSVDGAPIHTTVVPSGGPLTTATDVFTAVYDPGVHLVTVSVSDPGGCETTTCSTTVTVGTVSGGCAAPSAGACSLGQANGYAVFMMGNVAGTKSVITEATTKITGNVAVGPSVSGSSTDLIKATIHGKLFVDPSAVFGTRAGLTVTGGIVTQNLTTARNNALAASACYAALTPTRTIGSITGTTTLTGNGGLNVINVGSIVLMKKVLTLSGGANDIFIINVSGDFSVGATQVVLAGGVTAGHVLWNFPGGGTTVQVFKDSTSVSGTILAPYRDYEQHQAILNGSVIAGGNVSIHSGATVICSGGGCTP